MKSRHHSRPPRASQRGFSLVELSIVLVILGLLTGGILTGQNLIRAAELRSVVTEFQAYQTAVMTFRDQYFALPGDMTNATDFWGSANANATTCKTTQGTGTQTCNGDGDGKIDDGSTAAASSEAFRFWQQLANAGLLEGNFAGLSTDASNRQMVAGSNIPALKIPQVGAYVRYLGVISSNTATFDGDYGNMIQLGRANSTGAMVDQPFLTASELWNIDKKIDDGMPGLGRVRTYKPANSPDCAIDESNFDLTKTTLSCIVMFRSVF